MPGASEDPFSRRSTGTPTEEPIKVAVRVRPLSLRERAQGSTPVVAMDGSKTLIHTTPAKTFTFDHSFWSCDEKCAPFVSQEDLFNEYGSGLIRNALAGYNTSLFAYGQTGTGKSYTIMGIGDQPGLIPRSVDDLFRKRADGTKELKIWISYLEVHNETLRDLLSGDPSPELKIMDFPKTGVVVPKLTEAVVRTPADVQRLLDFGMKRRVTAATQMNARSSRSHAIFTMKIHLLEGGDRPAGAKDVRRVSHAKINLVDLAGSERQSKAGADALLLREGPSVNQSLATFSSVIKDLSENSSRKLMSPLKVGFRSSKLTFLLKDALMGNSKTCMIATISPATDSIGETLSTLRFASSVKRIKTRARPNRERQDTVAQHLEADMKRLRQHLDDGVDYGTMQYLTSQLKELEEVLHTSQLKELEEVLQHESSEYREQAEQEHSRATEVVLESVAGHDSSTPYLLNMSDDPMVAGCLIFYLPAGESTVVGAAKGNPIELRGIGISDRLCELTNSSNVEVRISKLSVNGRVCVNGKLMREGQSRSLNQGDKLYLGRVYALKLMVPLDPSSARDHGLSLNGLEDEWAALEDSHSWGSLQEYLNQVRMQMESDQARCLFEEMKLGCKLCDEGNEITSECRASEGLHFEVDLTSSVPSSIVIRVLQAGGPSPDSDTWSYNTLYLWSVPQMAERLERMRLFHEAMALEGPKDVDPLLDPWHEAHPGAISRRLREQSTTMAVQREVVAQARLGKDTMMRRSLMQVLTAEKAQNLRFVFGCWAQVRANGKPKDKVSTPARKQISTQLRCSPNTPRGSFKVGVFQQSQQGHRASGGRVLARKLARRGGPLDEAKDGLNFSTEETKESPKIIYQARGGHSRSAKGEDLEGASTSVPLSPTSPAVTMTPCSSGGCDDSHKGDVSTEDADLLSEEHIWPRISDPEDELEILFEAPDAGEGVVDQGSFKAELLVVLHALGVSDVASLRLHTEIRDGVVVTEVRGPANAVAEVRRLPRIEVMGRTVTQRSRERLGAAEDVRGATETETLKKQLEAAWQLCNVLRSRMQEQERLAADEADDLRGTPCTPCNAHGLAALSPRLRSGQVSPRIPSEAQDGHALPASPHPGLGHWSGQLPSGMSSPGVACRNGSHAMRAPPTVSRTRSHSPLPTRRPLLVQAPTLFTSSMRSTTPTPSAFSPVHPHVQKSPPVPHINASQSARVPMNSSSIRPNGSLQPMATTMIGTSVGSLGSAGGLFGVSVGSASLDSQMHVHSARPQRHVAAQPERAPQVVSRSWSKSRQLDPRLESGLSATASMATPRTIIT